MKTEPSPLRIVLTTTASAEEARKLGRALVEEGLAACVTLLPGAESIYRWKGQVESAAETLLLIKTAETHVERLEKRLVALHGYETPEFVVLAADSCAPGYLQWLLGSLSGGE